MIRLLVVILVAIQVGLLLLAASRMWQDPPLPDDPAAAQLSGNVSPNTAGTLESGLPSAREHALEWDADAELVLVSEQVDWPLEPVAAGAPGIAPGGWLTYIFANGSGEALSVELDRFTGNVTRTVETVWPDQSDVLLLYHLAVGSDEAVTAAEEIAGREFRSQCPAVRHRTVVTLTQPTSPASPVSMPATPLAGGTPGSPRATPESRSSLDWLITYADDGATDAVALILAVDTVSGEVVRIQNDLDSGGTPCGM